VKIFANIENNGYWVPGGTYYVDVWETANNYSTVDYETCPTSGQDDHVEATRLLRADSEIVAEASTVPAGDRGYTFGANGDFDEENPPVYDFETVAHTLDDWYGGLTLNSRVVLKEGNTRDLVRYSFDIHPDTLPSTVYLKMGSYNSGACLGV